QPQAGVRYPAENYSLPIPSFPLQPLRPHNAHTRARGRDPIWPLRPHNARTRARGRDPIDEFERETVARGPIVLVPFLTCNGSHLRLAKPRRRLGQRIEHWLEIEGRAADGLEHVGGGGLLLQ